MGGCDPWRYRHTIKNHIIVFKRTHIDRPHQTPATATKREREIAARSDPQDITFMPGLPIKPAYYKIDLDFTQDPPRVVGLS